MIDRRLKTFPSIVKSVEDLPPTVNQIARQVQPAIRQIIKIPPHEYPVRRTAWRFELPFRWLHAPERYLVFGETQIVIIEVDDGGTTSAEIPLRALIDIHLTGILLYASVELAWISGDHVETKKIEFNAVGSRLIEGAFQAARSMLLNSAAHPDPQVESTLEALPLKFHNYLRSSKLPAEQFQAILYQPAIRQPKGLMRGLSSPNRALGLTGDWLIVVEDAQHHTRARQGGVADYTMVRHFYPRAYLHLMALEPVPELPDLAWARLRIGTPQAYVENALPLLADTARALDKSLQSHAVTPGTPYAAARV